MFDKETILIIFLAGLIIFILMSNKDEYTACTQKSQVVSKYQQPNAEMKLVSNVPTFYANNQVECNPIAGIGCGPTTTFAQPENPMANTFTDKPNPFAGPISEFSYPMKFATKGSKMAMN